MKFNRCFGCMEEISSYPCPNCGFDPTQITAPNYVLPNGTILDGRYLVGKMLGRGGFGITYIGFDLLLQRKVAIKEYYPSGQVSRITTISKDLQWLDSEQPDQLRENGIRSCLREARKMAKIGDIPEVVRVLECFPENDTAYIVMDYVDGKTLMSVLREQGPMTWDQAKEIFLPAISAMEEVHQAGMVHRDISPDNLMLTKKGVRILDLGAAKDLGINNGASSALVVKGGFSPLEQYAHQGGSGPWTDVYAMAATIYHCLTGVIPPSALDRAQGDTMDWTLLKANGVPNHVIAALQNAMKLTARERTQSMAELLSQCQSNSAGRSKPKPVPEPDPHKKQPPVTEAPVHKIKKRIGGVFNQFRKNGNSKAIGFAIAFCAVVAVLIIFFMKGNVRKDTPQLNAYEPTAHIVNTESAIEHTDSDDANSNQTEPARSTVSEETEINTSVVNVNDVLSFGHYEQDGIRSNGAETIEWLVLDVQENKALLLSLYALDSLPYNNVYGNTTWEQCSLRSWLNGTFLETAFTAEEKTSILMTEVDNSRLQNNDEWPVKGSNNTEDLIFLLSYADTDRYFANAEARICTPTDYAVSMGADVRTLDDGITDAGWWWLRSPGEDSTQASFVNFDGTRYTNIVGNGYLSVRPALWIDLENYVPANEAADPQITEKRPIAVDGGDKHSVILYNDGTVITIGDNSYGQKNTAGWSNIVQISTYGNHTLGLTSSGHVVATGSNGENQCDVDMWEDIICVAAGAYHSVGLKRDGTVVAVGSNSSGQCNVDNWENITYVAANATSTFGLTKDGRILVCGTFQNRYMDNWQNVVSFSVSMNHVVALHSDGTVSAAGSNDKGQQDGLETKRDVVQVAAGYGFTAGLKNNGKVWVNGCDEHNEHAAMQWTDIVAIGTGTDHILGIKKDGTLVAKGANEDGQCDVYPINQLLEAKTEE